MLPLWIRSTLRLNWNNLIAHKGAFWSTALLMCVQNLIYFGLWVAIFSQISSLRGWGLREVAYLYGAGAISYGFIFTIFGGIHMVADIIHNGQLDVYLARPRLVLLSTMLHQMRSSSIGDLLCGVIMLALFVQPTWADLPLIAVLSFSAGLVYASFRLAMHTLAFWGLGAEGAENGFIAFIIASTNPQNGFGAWGKLVLLSVFPAGYVAFLPVEILREFSWALLAWQVGASVAITALAIGFFHVGLRRYASGNLMMVLR